MTGETFSSIDVCGMIRAVMQYKNGVIGGTFDRIHKGHEALLTHAFSLAERVTIGLTTDNYVAQTKNDSGLLMRQPYAVRKVKLEEWLGGKRLLDRATIIPIEDVFGPTVIAEGANTHDRDLDRKATSFFDVIIVSQDSKKGAERINEKRTEQKLSPLHIETIPMVIDLAGKPISGTRIRRAEIDLNGTLLMPAPLKAELEKPFGELIESNSFFSRATADTGNMIIAVGDRTVEFFLNAGIPLALAVIDRQSRRKPHAWSDEHIQLFHDNNRERIQSGPGYISQSAMDWIKQWCGQSVENRKKGQTIPMAVLDIEGEEDLLTLPIAYFAPNGTIIYYGQPGKGVVRLVVDNTVKDRAALLLVQFVRQQ